MHAKDFRFEPTGNRVILRLDEVDGRTEGGLYMPQTADAGLKKARVVAVSDTYFVNGQQQKIPYKINDHVFVDPLGATHIRIFGGDLLVVRFEDLVGYFEDDREA